MYILIVVVCFLKSSIDSSSLLQLTVSSGGHESGDRGWERRRAKGRRGEGGGRGEGDAGGWAARLTRVHFIRTNGISLQ